MLNKFSLYLVTDSQIIGKKGIFEVVQSAIDGGVSAVQLREKNCTGGEFVEVGKKLKSLLRRANVPLIINDRIDVAQIIEADGVHLGQSDINISDARKILGKKSIIGLTIEKLSQLKRVNHLQLDYIGVSSIFPTNTKKNINNYWSEAEIKELRKVVPLPLVGIGGINKLNAKKALSYGLDGIAVVSAICGKKTLDEVRESARRLKSIVEEYHGY